MTKDEIYTTVFNAVRDAMNTSHIQSDQIMTTEELAEFLNYTPALILALRKQGKIPYLGEKSYRYSKREVLASLKNK